MGDRSIVYIMDVINQLLTAGHQLSGSCTYRSDCVAAPAFFGQFERFWMGMVPLEFRVAFPFHVCWLQFFARQLFAKYPDLLCSETHFLLVKSLFLLGEIPIARSPPSPPYIWTTIWVPDRTWFHWLAGCPAGLGLKFLAAGNLLAMNHWPYSVEHWPQITTFLEIHIYIYVNIYICKPVSWYK